MSVTVTAARYFIYDGREFPDPDPALSIDEVRKQMADFFPELINADYREETKEGQRRITFSRRIGTKGVMGHDAVLAALGTVPAKRLRLLELAAQAYADPASYVHPDQADFNLAVAEAQAYARDTTRSTEALARLSAR
jgi:PRTRC genetic system protein C